MWTEHRLISFDETPIFYRHLKTSGPTKGVVIFLHGMGEHGGRYRHIAEYLSGLGLECVIPDLRGFGNSGGRRGYVRRFSDHHRDVAALHSFVARTHKEIPVFLLGHSFGGLIASSYLAFCEHSRINGLILSSPIFGIAVSVPGWRHVLGVIGSILFPAYSQPSTVTPPMLTHDKEMLEIYKRDPLIYHYVSARLYRELVMMIARRKSIAEKLDIPILVVQAGEDYVVSKQDTLNFYDALKCDDKELEVYPEYFHEVLNEIGRDKVFSRIGFWILKRLNDNSSH